MSSNRPLQDDGALVTGASSGIGRAAAHSLARDGANVALAARRENRLKSIADELADEFNIETQALPMDVTDPNAVTSAVETTVDAFGALYIVVSNAGVGCEAFIEDLTLESYHQLMDVNVNGAFYVARAALPRLRESAGTLIFVGSYAGRYPYPKNPVYGASKWWIRGFALSIAGAVGDNGVAVTVVNPTKVRTEFGSEYRKPNEDLFEGDRSRNPKPSATR